MSGGQHRDDEANGPSQSGEVKRKEAGVTRAINQAQKHGCLRKSKKPYLTEPTSLEMFSTVTATSPNVFPAHQGVARPAASFMSPSNQFFERLCASFAISIRASISLRMAFWVIVRLSMLKFAWGWYQT
jgi:hypothetical protein